MQSDISDSKWHQFRLVIQKSLEGSLSSKEVRFLRESLMGSAEARQHYIEYVMIHSSLFLISAELSNESNDQSVHAIHKALLDLSEYEKTAPEIRSIKEMPQRELIQHVVYPPREKRQVSTFNKVFLATSAAAIFFFFLFFELTPPKGGNQVATLTDSLNAKWMEVEREMVKGTSITTSEKSLFLREGYAELMFDNQVRVTIEGPAEFKVLAEDDIKLCYGRLYARVPREAIGFTVKTPSAQIVDLGTEFGVDCSLHSDTSLHVMKGKTVLIAGDKSNKVSIEVKNGVAKKVLAATQTISDIPCNDRLFAREINSVDNVVWRGETEISLADIIAGGNGFGKVPSLIGLNPATGQYTFSVVQNDRRSKKSYNLVPDSKFIDGLFVPDGGAQVAIPITSSGQTFECPDTEGLFTHEIVVFTGDIGKWHPTIQSAIFNGKLYTDSPILMLHSNLGITFDLQEIRQSLPACELKSFKAFGGLTEAIKGVTAGMPDVGFWILVDGQIRYEKKVITLEDASVSFDIKLSPRDRFLTLMVTDGFRPGEEARGYLALSNDFFYLVDPKLYMAETTD